MSMVWLLIVAALALILLGGAAWLWNLARGQERTEEVLTRLHSGGEEATVLSLGDTPEMSIPGMRWISRLLWRTGSEVRPRSILMLLAGLLVLIVVICLGAGPLLGLAISAFLLLVIYVILAQRAASRRSKIIEQLPVFLESLIRIMSAGNSLEESLASAARESSGPIRPLFMSISRQVKLGAPIDQVLSEAGTLYRLRDLKIMSLAANVNRRYGGSLRSVMKSMILAIRQRGLAAKELRALTAETRFSAVIVALVPFGITVFIYWRNPHFYDAMWHNPVGHWLLIGALGWMVAGAALLWRMVNAIGDED